MRPSALILPLVLPGIPVSIPGQPMRLEQGGEVITGYRQHLAGTIDRLEANGAHII